MSGERAPEGQPRRSEGAHGGGRRRAGAPEFGPAELAAALRDSVAPIGAAGPPRAGLARIRRRAKARQRRRTVMAGSAGVLVLAMAVSVVTGNSFDIVPVLTGVVGLGGSHTSSGASPSAQGGGGAQVRTVRPPADAAGKKGPAIGPLDAVASVPTALAATGVPQCTATDLTTSTMVDAVIGGVSYGHVEAVAQHTCAVAGPPVLQVENAAGTAASSVVILQHAKDDGSQLPDVPTWGTVLKLQAGQGYDFQFAWAPDECQGASASAGAGSTGAATGPSGRPSATGQAAPESLYTLSYLIADVTPAEPESLAASCGATVYVTDIYQQGAYPTARPPASPSAQSTSPSAPATTPSPSASTSSSPPPTTSSSSASPSGSTASSTGNSGGPVNSPAGATSTASSSPQQPTNS